MSDWWPFRADSRRRERPADTTAAMTSWDQVGDAPRRERPPADATAAKTFRDHLGDAPGHERPPADATAAKTLRDHVGDALWHDRPPADAVAAMLRRAAGEPEPVRPRRGFTRHVSFAAQLLVAQVRLIRVSVWMASVVVMGLGVLLASQALAASVLAIVAPFVAAAGIAAVCGPDRDPGVELLSSTVTSPRVVLTARVTLVFGFDLVLALVGSVVLAGVGVDAGLAKLIGAWLGPMALLSSVCLLLGVAVGTTAAITVSLALWVIRVLAPTLAAGTAAVEPVAGAITWLWSTSLPTGVIAAAMLAGALALAGRMSEPWARRALRS